MFINNYEGFLSVLRIQSLIRIRMFLCLLDLDTDPGTDPDPDPSIIKQK
jgi:hypothetical protein